MTCHHCKKCIQSPSHLRLLGKRARRLYLSKYTPDVNYKMLMEIYFESITSQRFNMLKLKSACCVINLKTSRINVKFFQGLLVINQLILYLLMHVIVSAYQTTTT